jgi:hypothetical protein
MYTKISKLFAILILSFMVHTTISAQLPQPGTGVFEKVSDIGGPDFPGKILYEEETQEYLRSPSSGSRWRGISLSRRIWNFRRQVHNPTAKPDS